jgi:hypothetical protein
MDGTMSPEEQRTFCGAIARLADMFKRPETAELYVKCTSSQGFEAF